METESIFEKILRTIYKRREDKKKIIKPYQTEPYLLINQS